MCSVCGFAFCVACKKTYHGADDCQQEKPAGSNAEKETEQGKLKLPNSKGTHKYYYYYIITILIKVIVSARCRTVYIKPVKVFLHVSLSGLLVRHLSNK